MHDFIRDSPYPDIKMIKSLEMIRALTRLSFQISQGLVSNIASAFTNSRPDHRRVDCQHTRQSKPIITFSYPITILHNLRITTCYKSILVQKQNLQCKGSSDKESS
jgi:hypothetical protein